MSEDEHELRSYGRRRGRKPSVRQGALLRDVLPRVAFDPSKPLSGPARIWLEIGFGGGEHLLWQARNNPGVALIGCEPYEDGVIKVLGAIELEALTNMRIHMGDAREILRALPASSIERAFILFPDPWPKRKHQKRRLVNASLIDLLARVLKPGAELRLATDIGDYAGTMLEAIIPDRRFSWQAEGPADWRTGRRIGPRHVTRPRPPRPAESAPIYAFCGPEALRKPCATFKCPLSSSHSNNTMTD